MALVSGPGCRAWVPGLGPRLWTRDQGLGLRPGSGPGVQDLSLGPETLVFLRFFMVFWSGGRKPWFSFGFWCFFCPEAGKPMVFGDFGTRARKTLFCLAKPRVGTPEARKTYGFWSFWEQKCEKHCNLHQVRAKINSIPRSPRIPAETSHRVRVGAYLPHAPGARITVVN